VSQQFDRRALGIYAKALDLPLEQREAFLRAEAGDSAELLEILLAMLGVGTAPQERLAALLAEQTRGLSELLSLEGMQLGDFRLLRQVGRGASGNVYEAEQLSLKRRVAVKVLNPLYVDHQDVEHRFGREPEILAMLTHPNIVRVISSAVEGELHYFAMEFIRGENLHALIAGQRSRPPGERVEACGLDLLSHAACARLIVKIAGALHFAHGKHVLHRDVKPHNILVDTQGEPFLTDFGLAKAIDRSALTSAMGDGLKGTLAYMSPEQAREFRSVDARADVYSLGAVLYELLTLRPLFEAETAVELLQKIERRHPIPAHRVVPGLDRRLSAICSRALEKAPGERYESAQALADDLQRFLEGKSVGATPVVLQVGERRLDRRALLLGSMGTTSLAAASVYGATRWLDERPRLTLRLPPGTRGARVSLMPVLPPYGLLGAADERGSFRGEELELGRIEPGTYRVVITADDGAVAELQRTLRNGADVTLQAYPSLPGPMDGAMVRVSGGTVTVDGSAVYDLKDETTSLPCQPFWIDRAAVTNREFRAFLEATGRWPSSEWPDKWLAVWDGKVPERRKDWDELPVVKVDWELARAYAEWKGKRLPTVEEWLCALGPGWSDLLAPDRWDKLASTFVVGKPKSVAWSDAQPDADAPKEGSTLAAYLKYVEPSRLEEQRAFGPYHLWHPFGNVSQWLGTESFFATEDGGMETGQMRLLAFSPWHLDTRQKTYPIASTYAHDTAGDLGFRCAKTATT
jgi:serine/threonine protein kinase/formylglycine-generating enzyme required for sulfatase activity